MIEDDTDDQDISLIVLQQFNNKNKVVFSIGNFRGIPIHRFHLTMYK